MHWTTTTILDLHRVYLANASQSYTDEFLNTPQRRNRAFRFTVNIYDFCDRVAWFGKHYTTGREGELTADLQKTYSDWIRNPVCAYSANAQSPQLNAQTQNLEIVAYSRERIIPHRRPVDMKLEGLWYPADVGEPHRNILTTELCPDTRDGSLCCTFVLLQGQIYRELVTKMAPQNFDMEGVLCRRSKPYIYTEDSERPPPPGQIIKLGN
jgi:hypothetical protein